MFYLDGCIQMLHSWRQTNVQKKKLTLIFLNEMKEIYTFPLNVVGKGLMNKIIFKKSLSGFFSSNKNVFVSNGFAHVYYYDVWT